MNSNNNINEKIFYKCSNIIVLYFKNFNSENFNLNIELFLEKLVELCLYNNTDIELI